MRTDPVRLVLRATGGHKRYILCEIVKFGFPLPVDQTFRRNGSSVISFCRSQSNIITHSPRAHSREYYHQRRENCLRNQKCMRFVHNDTIAFFVCTIIYKYKHTYDLSVYAFRRQIATYLHLQTFTNYCRFQHTYFAFCHLLSRVEFGCH